MQWMDKIELGRFIDRILKPAPAQASLDIYDFSKRHRAIVVSEYGRFLKMFEDFFDSLNDSISLLNYVPKKNWHNNRSVQYLFFPETLKTLHCAFEVAIDGYYYESVMLLRSVYEACLRIVFISCFPNDWESVFNKLPNKRKFNVTAFVKDDLKLDWGFIYRTMCVISHSKSHHHLMKLIEWPKDPEYAVIQLEYKWNEEMFALATNLIKLDLCFLFHLMITLFIYDLDNDAELKNRKIQLININQALLGLIHINPVSSFSSLADDILKVGKIVRAADAGEDWSLLV